MFLQVDDYKYQINDQRMLLCNLSKPDCFLCREQQQSNTTTAKHIISKPPTVLVSAYVTMYCEGVYDVMGEGVYDVMGGLCEGVYDVMGGLCEGVYDVMGGLCEGVYGVMGGLCEGVYGVMGGGCEKVSLIPYSFNRILLTATKPKIALNDTVMFQVPLGFSPQC